MVLATVLAGSVFVQAVMLPLLARDRTGSTPTTRTCARR
jgi:hypothetical protein